MTRYFIIASFLTLCRIQIPASEPLLEETFDYAGDSGKMTERWTKNMGNPAIVTRDNHNPELPPPYLSLNNRYIYLDLTKLNDGKPITQDFTLTAKVLHGEYYRMLWMGVLDETGTKGYTAVWNSGNPQNFGGQGAVTICKLNLKNPLNHWRPEVIKMTRPTGGIHHPLQSPWANLKLTWRAKDGRLQLFMDGKCLREVTDTDFSQFSRLYLAGNGENSGLFDQVVFTVN